MAGVYGPREAKIHQRSSEESIVTVSIAASRADRDAGRCVPAASPCLHAHFFSGCGRRPVHCAITGGEKIGVRTLHALSQNPGPQTLDPKP